MSRRAIGVVLAGALVATTAVAAPAGAADPVTCTTGGCTVTTGNATLAVTPAGADGSVFALVPPTGVTGYTVVLGHVVAAPSGVTGTQLLFVPIGSAGSVRDDAAAGATPAGVTAGADATQQNLGNAVGGSAAGSATLSGLTAGGVLCVRDLTVAQCAPAGVIAGPGGVATTPPLPPLP